MKTVKDLKKWLEQFPEETVVYFAKQNSPIGWESWGDVKFVEPDLDLVKDNYGYGNSWEFSDLTESKWHKEKEKFHLYLGSKE